MDQRTLDALKGSIEKWEQIVAGDGQDRAVRNCALCQTFWNDDCTGCPVALKTGKIECAGTPYDQWTEDRDSDWFNGCKANTPKEVGNAKAMLDFLKELLPEGEVA